MLLDKLLNMSAMHFTPPVVSVIVVGCWCLSSANAVNRTLPDYTIIFGTHPDNSLAHFTTRSSKYFTMYTKYMLFAYRCMYTNT